MNMKSDKFGNSNYGKFSAWFIHTDQEGYNGRNGSFTLPDSETDTDIDKMCTKPNGNFSLNSINTSTQFCTSPFYRSPSRSRSFPV